MLSAAPVRPALVPLRRLASAAGETPATAIDWTAPIDSSRWFICETLTPLYYTRVYRELAEAQRRRYNQLTGMLSNELILRLETGFLAVSLAALAEGEDAAVGEAAARFAAEEQRHAEVWRRLNRLSDPDRYAATDACFVRPIYGLEAVGRLVARHPTAWPLVFWVQLSQEERSIDISRRCLRMPDSRIEPRYAAAHREHVRDEARHVQIDCHLIERYYTGHPMAMRRLTAAAMRLLIGSVFLRPVRSTVRVVQALTSEHPELRPLLPRMVAELRALAGDDEYHRAMYSREATPITFAWFDRFPELHSMSRVLRGYRPARAARDA